MTRQLHNTRQAGVFDEQARSVVRGEDARIHLGPPGRLPTPSDPSLDPTTIPNPTITITHSFFAGEEATPPDVVPRLHAIAAAGKPLGPTSRVLDIGTGAGVLIPFFKALGVAEANIMGVDVSPGMLAVARRRYPQAAFWEGDVADFEAGQQGSGLFDAVYFNAVFGNLYDQGAALAAVGRAAARGARVVIRWVGLCCVGEGWGGDRCTRA